MAISNAPVAPGSTLKEYSWPPAKSASRWRAAATGTLNSDWWKNDFGIDSNFVNAVATIGRTAA